MQHLRPHELAGMRRSAPPRPTAPPRRRSGSSGWLAMLVVGAVSFFVTWVATSVYRDWTEGRLGSQTFDAPPAGYDYGRRDQSYRDRRQPPPDDRSWFGGR